MYFIEHRRSDKYGKWFLVYKNEKKVTKDVAFFLSQEAAIEYVEWKNKEANANK